MQIIAERGGSFTTTAGHEIIRDVEGFDSDMKAASDSSGKRKTYEPPFGNIIAADVSVSTVAQRTQSQQDLRQHLSDRDVVKKAMGAATSPREKEVAFAAKVEEDANKMQVRSRLEQRSAVVGERLQSLRETRGCVRATSPIRKEVALAAEQA